ncbi:hypothetical protein KBK19_01655 [Microvirga sp. STR05]|uniref:Transmembrane protein n=1 Tax=Hymenobacter duratus TaxID=2771356 RepID=A0ABR8JAT9_9BACT|nr:hypothetical protein [Hymenobacter duratus]MBD2713734.1 hypothetical protein [Hymenobacter duratus]MBR7948636.1 hypothetical protein [Microvirga sp. STR05]
MKNVVTVVAILFLWLLLVSGYLGAFILSSPLLTFMLGAAVALVVITVWGMLPYWVYQQLIRLSDLPPGPLLTGLNWWLAGTYCLMPVVAGLLVLIKGFRYFSDPENLLPYLIVWLVPMLVAIAPGYIGLRRWYAQQGQE